MTRYFITGTDTDCGKTYVTCQLLDYLHHAGHSALAIKPIASGAIGQQGQWISEDVLRLQAHNGPQAFPINGWLFPDPVSPHLAAKRQGVSVSAKDIADFCADKRFRGYDAILVEGAGGLMVPLNGQETWLDVLALTAMPVILVVGMRLGCINHALLTDAVLRENKLHGLGWIANCLDNTMLALDENINTLIDKMSLPWLGTVSWDGDFQLNKDFNRLPLYDRQ